MLGERFGSISFLPGVPWELCYRGDLRLHLISLSGFCWFHSPAQRNDGGELLVKKWVVPIGFPTSFAGLRLKLWHHRSYVAYLLMYLSVCGREGEGEEHCRETGAWKLPQVLGEGVSASEITTVVWASS